MEAFHPQQVGAGVQICSHIPTKNLAIRNFRAYRLNFMHGYLNQAIAAITRGVIGPDFDGRNT
jgi:hypothetical protein